MTTTPDAFADAALFDMELPPPVSLADRFHFMPFSVIDRRQGDWLARKRKWLSLGIQSELGREENLLYGAGDDFVHQQMQAVGGTSVFDPVLCELAYRWFSDPGDHVLDPFAGGSIRGIAAAMLERGYTGVDLRAEQVAANRAQWQELAPRYAEHLGVQVHVPVADELDVVADERPSLSHTHVATGPGSREAQALYAATSSLPLRSTWDEPLPAELWEYLQLVYAGAPQEFTAERATGATQAWAQLVDNGTCWVAFTGGKDSVAAALLAEEAGHTVVLYHLAGLNRGMADELGYARRIAAARGWRLVVERVAASGKKDGLIELPTKNQVTALYMLNRMAAEGGAYWSAGWHGSDTQDKQDFTYDYSDGVDAIARFGAYLAARYPGNLYVGDLHDTTEAWARVTEAGLLRLVKGCVCPVRFKERVRAANEAKFGPLLEGRCGSCVKCAWEWVALEELGVVEPHPELRAHGAQYLLRDMAGRTDGGSLAEVEQFLVPAEEAAKWFQEFWPEQVDPATVDVPDDTSTAAAPPAAPEPTRQVATGGGPTWVAGDSTTLPTLLPADARFDLVFSCPPYGDLEVYSDDPADLSNMPYSEFLRLHAAVVKAAVDRLHDDRFAVWVTSDIRDKDGNYRGLPGDTIRHFQEAGAALYNDAIILDPVGTVRLRAGNLFSRTRKLGRLHQHMLIFVKGDGKRAARRLTTLKTHDLGDAAPTEEA